jgi:malic enzyme
VTSHVAQAVIRQAAADGVARHVPDDPAEAVAAAMWEPGYPVLEVS